MPIPDPSTHTHTYILITGANSGLGYAICTRLIDEFLSTRPPTAHLHLIPTVRTRAKAEDTTRRLKEHLASALRNFDLDGHAGEDSESDEEEEHDHEEEEELLRYHMQRVSIRPELVDLTDLVSVRTCAGRLLGEEASDGRLSGGPGEEGGGTTAGKIPKLDAVIWNAGIGGWLGIHTLQGIWGMATDLVETVTRPKFKIGSLGRVCMPLGKRYPMRAGSTENRRVGGGGKMDQGMLEKVQQTHSSTTTTTTTETIESEEQTVEEPPLGEIFTANVFGHYMLGHYLSPLISKGWNGGRIVWVSSVEADLGAFDANVDDDIMGLRSSVVYEDMKRLVDLLALTADLEGARRYVDGYFASSQGVSSSQPHSISQPQFTSQQRLQQQQDEQKQGEVDEQQQHTPNTYTTHPGICMSEILPQPIYIKITTFFVLWLARLLGSIWHPIQPYKGAVSAVWVALADEETLEGFGDDSNPTQTNHNSKYSTLR